MTSEKPSALRRYRALLVLVPILAAAAGAFFYFQRKNITLAASPIERVPQTTSAVLHLDVAAVVGSPLWQRVVVARRMDAPLVTIRERCGFDPVDQIEELTFFSVGANPSSLDHVGVVAEGPFEHERLAECVRKALTAEGGGATMRRVEIDGVPAVASSRDESRAAFLGERGIAVGMLPTVRSVIATARKDAPSAKANALLARLWSTVSPGREIVLVGNVPSRWQESVQQLLGGSDRAAMVTRTLDGLRAIGLGFRVSSGLGFGGMLNFANATQARGLATTLRTQLDTLKNNIMVSLTPVGPIVRTVQVEHRDTDVVITLDIPQERLDRLLEFADSLGGGGAPIPSTIPRPSMPAPAPTPAPAPAPDQVVPGMR